MGPVTVVILPQLFFLMARMTSSKTEEIMIYGVMFLQTVARGGGGGGGLYSDIFIHT